MPGAVKCARYPLRSNFTRSGQGIRVCNCAVAVITPPTPADLIFENLRKIACCGKNARQIERSRLHGLAKGARMAIEDDDKPRKKVTHEIGQDLSLLSVEELTERIALMTSEIERLQAAMTRKRASKEAANSFFKS
jgi:uncharacterized small protein (DUF1192 family)